MKDTTPTSVAEYNARFAANTKITGFAMEVGTRYPCPFCAAPNYMFARIMDAQAEMAKEHTCKECGRSGKAIFETPSPGHMIFEMVQTGGDDVPEWFFPKMRRV